MKSALIGVHLPLNCSMPESLFESRMNNGPLTAGAPRPNRLAGESSPYLLQHQFNPVDWHPWGEEAFAKARLESRVIFLSIGYSTCHWCHVMERESFENPMVADFLNRHFVSIKVDREERPDIDRIYMNAVQALTGQGGWPLSVFLTPELKPFYGGTYFPPESRHGRPGFLAVLQRIHDLWHQRRDDLQTAALDLVHHLENLAQLHHEDSQAPTVNLLSQAMHRLKRAFDPEYGGFGTAPKFPHPSQPGLLLRCAARFKDAEARHMVLSTCDRMASGGIHDQLGGGFARYAVDAQWLVPHFEKMLYDNAQLAQLYLDVFLVSSNPYYAEVVRDILGYVQRDLTHPGGGFFSAEDADSEGKEGKFYCWTRAELSRVLSPEELNTACRFFGVTETGNFVDHSDPDPLPGLNVLHVAQRDVSEEDQPILARARQKLLAVRERRARPQRDDKILVSWNGLMLGAFARAGVVLSDAAFVAAADRNWRFIQTHLWDPATATLHHRWREGHRDSVQLLSAYAFLLNGVVDLYEATLDPGALEFALALAESMITRFHDPQKGGFWPTTPEAKDLIVRVKEDHDGAEPAGNSLAIHALLRLSGITGRVQLREPAVEGLRHLTSRLEQVPLAFCALLQALDFCLQEPIRIVLTGPTDAPQFQDLLCAAHQVYLPNKVLLGTSGPVDALAQKLSLTHDPAPAAAHVCTSNACLPPILDPAALKQQLLTLA
jgi:hypothetical protein